MKTPRLSPDQVASLVAKAFCLEALADKKDCTSRYVDLAGRPLEGFIMAGLNSAPYFAEFAKNRQHGDRSVYSNFVAALRSSNTHKSEKYVNFGLLEMMFPVVAARLLDVPSSKVVSTINEVLSAAPAKDVAQMILARKVAWATSSSAFKFGFKFTPEVKRALSPADFYTRLKRSAPEDITIAQWVDQHEEGWPLLRELLEDLQSQSGGELLPAIKAVFDPVRERHPDIKVGILADMCAAAIFLHLSYLPQHEA